jgi:D-alanyl-D-alanine carboxypeptidase-like protein
MYRRSIGVWTTIALSLLAFADPIAARTSHKSIQQKTPATAGRTSANGSRDPKASSPHKTGNCAPCAAELARTRNGRSLKTAAKTANNLPCHSKNYVDPNIATNYKAALREMKREGIKPKVTSTWRSSDVQKRLHECSESARCRRAHPGLYYALPSGKSLHEAGLAVDISGVAAGPRGRKLLTPQGHRIVSIMRKNGFNWRYRLADPAHFEADPKKHGYRNTKQAIAQSQATCQVKLANKDPKRTVTKTASRQPRLPSKTQLSAQTSTTRAHRHLPKMGA